MTGAALLAALALLAVLTPLGHGLLHAMRLLASGDSVALRAWVLAFGAWAPVVSAALMILQAVAAPLPASAIAYVNGLVFGAWWGSLLSWASALIAAGFCFALSRVLGRPVVERLVSARAVEWSDRFFARYGTRAVLIGRLVPVISFDVVSYGAGLTPIPFWRFLVATAVGMSPATIVYSYLGHLGGSSSSAFVTTLTVLTALAVLVMALEPILARRLVAKRAARDTRAKR